MPNTVPAGPDQTKTQSAAEKRRKIGNQTVPMPNDDLDLVTIFRDLYEITGENYGVDSQVGVGKRTESPDAGRIDPNKAD
ncbi:hypothetical protein GCM10027423_19000 [Spirosoma arcticum]